ncbi:MAG TPA: polyphenol oxidase family protein [Gemmatimonadales bacterium]|jgi:YfiH family protein|nr:polyphenol oxidase family protein [Gemmatimonadales bacterium]
MTEAPVAGAIPRYELGEWRQYGIVAGITARGGDSGAGFDLGLWTREPTAEVMTRWRDFRRAARGFTGFAMSHQVHGAELAWHGEVAGWTILDGVDGHLTSARGVLLLVTVADCVPVYLTLPGRAVALLHAGWRGTAAGILGRGVAELCRATDCQPHEIVAHFGVGICGACYEVGSEVMSGCGLPADGAGPWHLDLRRALADQAAEAGVRSVTSSTWCSAHDRPRFYSHRASGGTDGRMVAFIGMPGSGD